MLTIEAIRNLYTDETIAMTAHVLLRCQQRGIGYDDITQTILNGEIIEQYPDDYPFPSCLVSCKLTQMHLHVVVGMGDNRIWIVTAYYPDSDRWQDDFKTRKEDE